MRVLVTGALGSGGSYLCEWLIKNKRTIEDAEVFDFPLEVIGLARWHSKQTLPEPAGYSIMHCDLNDPFRTQEVINDLRPDIIFHMAGYADVQGAFQQPSAVLHNNTDATLNILESVRRMSRRTLDNPVTRVVLCSSSEVYGNVDGVITEDSPLAPISPYAVSKLVQDRMGYAWYKSYGLDVVLTRAFTYINPRRADLFATSFAMQIAMIEAGKQDTLIHGNLKSERTMMSVNTMCEHYWTVARRGEAGEAYNVAGDLPMAVGDVLLELIGYANCTIMTQLSQHLVRPVDIGKQVPDITKLKELGSIIPPVEGAPHPLLDLLNHCREVVNGV